MSKVNVPKILFVHGTKIELSYDNKLYTTGSYNMKVWERYLFHTNYFTVLAFLNKNKLSISNNKNYLDSNRIRTKLIVNNNSSKILNYLFPKKKKIKAFIEKQIIEHDLIIVRMPSRISNIAFDLATKHNKKIIVEVVGSAFDSLWYHSFKGKILAFNSHFQMKKRVLYAKNVIYVTEKYLQKQYPTLGSSIPCSNVVLSKGNINSRSKFDLSNDVLRIGIIGKTDVRYKGHKTIIAALSHMKIRGFSNFVLEIVGDGDKTKILNYAHSKKLSNNILFLSTIEHNKIYDWLSKINIYIQPSLTEGLPRSVIEAMASGCVVIGSDAGGIPELLNHNMIFKKGKYKELVKILYEILHCDLPLNDYILNNKAKALEFLQENLEIRRNNFIRGIIENDNFTQAEQYRK